MSVLKGPSIQIVLTGKGGFVEKFHERVIRDVDTQQLFTELVNKLEAEGGKNGD